MRLLLLWQKVRHQDWRVNVEGVFFLSADTQRIVPGVHSGVEIVVVLQPVVVLRHPHGEGVGLAEETVAQGGAQVGAEDTEEYQRRQELDQEEEGEVGQAETELEI